MGSKKNAARKKKRISKHLLQSTETSNEASASLLSPPTLSAKPSTKKGKKSSKIKDPSEAAAYLSAWKHRDAGGSWKFNKNTQSWLIRHMYETDKVSKLVFGSLVEYLGGLQGQTRLRVLSDASRRATRYKEFEAGEGDDSAKKGPPENKDQDEGNQQGSKLPGAQPETTGRPKDSVDDEDQLKWDQLDDHGKRKEYKRARKVLETIRSSDPQDGVIKDESNQA